MPDDNRLLVDVDIEFGRLPDDTAGSCPVDMSTMLEYLAVEFPDGERLRDADLEFLRTALVGDHRYWIWQFTEPNDGDDAYLTVSTRPDGCACISYEADYYSLTPEQFMLGDYHGVF